jgi:hypothetical protein
MQPLILAGGVDASELMKEFTQSEVADGPVGKFSVL